MHPKSISKKIGPETIDPVESFIDELAHIERPILYSDLYYCDEVSDKNLLIERLLADRRFLHFGIKKDAVEDYVISIPIRLVVEKALYLNKHFYENNLVFVNIQDAYRIYNPFSKLSETQFMKLIRFCFFFGLAALYENNTLYFPSADIIFSLIKKFGFSEVLDILYKNITGYYKGKDFKKDIQNILNSILSEAKIKQIHIQTYRSLYGFEDGNPKTLEAVGYRLGVTRERIRQIVTRINKMIISNPEKKRSLLEIQLLLLLMVRFRRLVKLKTQTPTFAYFKYMEKILNSIYLNKIKLENFYFIDTTKDKFASFEAFSNFLYDESLEFSPLNKKFKFFPNEIRWLEKAATKEAPKKVKVYICLKKIGRPAHYSEVAQKYRELFDVNISERSIHATLSRYQDLWVWTGVRGVFALKEWGYEKPKDTVFDLAYRVISQIYKKTNKPVSFDVAFAEAQKERKLLKRYTFFCACIYNKMLERVDLDKFIPISNELKVFPETKSASQEKNRNDIGKALKELSEKFSKKHGEA